MNIHTKNPATGESLNEYVVMSQQAALGIAEKTHEAQKKWKDMSVTERLPYFTSLAKVLREQREEYATLMTNEMGKPIKESRAEVEKCAWLAEFFADNAEKWLQDKQVDADGKKHLVTFEPLGVVFMIMPWNYPFWQPLKVGIPPLLAGNGIVLKHASNVTGSALAIEDAFRKAGFPEDLFRTIIIGHGDMPALLASPHIHAGSLTGSERAGEIFAAEAGKNLKKVVLELGGSDPLIVLPDADIAAAAKGAVKGRFSNAGQVCISSKRLIVHNAVREKFTAAFVAEVEALTIGDPLEEDTDIGPLVNEKAAAEMECFVADAVERGATVLVGGKRHELGGAYFEPTVFADATEDMRIVCNEVFGPIAPILSFETEEEAIAIANNSDYGLSGSIWTKDLAKGEALARNIHTGSVFINSTSKTDPRLPVGGIKRSGYGRELSEYGLLEFVNVKTINIYE